MSLSYEITNWENGKTVLKAEHLRKIEKGITDIISENDAIYKDEDIRKSNEKQRQEEHSRKMNEVSEVVSDIQKDYDSLQKIIIDENASANLQNQINQTNSQLAQIEKQEYVNVSSFGAVGDCIEGDWYTLPTGTDDTQAIQEAFNYASENGLKLVFEQKKYLITDTLNFDKPCDIDFNNATLIPFICEINKPSILCSSQSRKTWTNLSISGRGFLQNGIQFTKPDNQAMKLSNIKVYGCRHGIYLDEDECVNRAIFTNCDFSSNMIAGVYFKSFETDWGHSAPVHFNKCICNANGIPDWVTASHQYNGVTVLQQDDKYGYQVYFKGFTLLSWLDGQISNHGNHKNISLALFDSVNGLKLTGDVEDCDCLTDFNGNKIDCLVNSIEDLGNAIYLKACATANIDILSPYNVNSTGLVTLRYCSGNYYFNIASDNKSKYHCRVLNSDNLRIFYNGDLSNVSDDCLARVNNIIPYKSIRCVDFNKVDVKESNFDNVVSDDINYLISPFDYNTIDTNNYFNIYNLNSVNKIFIKMLVSSNSYSPDGRVFVAFYDNKRTYLHHELISLKGSGAEGAYYNCHKSIDKPSNAIYCKVGFCNNGTYQGTIKDHCMNPKKIEVYLLGSKY